MSAKRLASSKYQPILGTLVVSILLVTLGTCKGPLFGLGGAVDLEAPRSISVAPGQGSYRSGIIAISGVAEDAYGLQSVEVRILDRGSGAIVRTYAATISGTSWTTGDVVNTDSFPDGLYTIAVILKDARGNATEDRVLVGFDNRPPTVLIEEPLELAKAYNGNVIISGQAYDSMSNITAVSVALYRAGDGAPLFKKLSNTVPKWSVLFDASNPAYGLGEEEDLILVVTAMDEGENENSWQYEYLAAFQANQNNQLTASQLDQLDALQEGDGFIPDLSPLFTKATLEGLRKQATDGNAVTPSVLKVDIDSDKPYFTFVTPGASSIDEATAERFAGGTKANGTVSDDDLNTLPMTVNYRYALVPGDITAAAWNPATVEGTGYEQRWSFIMPGATGMYKVQLQAFDNGGAEGLSEPRYFIIDDGRPLVSFATDAPERLYYGKDQTILISGTATREGVGNFIDTVQVSVGSIPWTDVSGLTGIGTSNVVWTNHSISLSGLTGGSTQIKVRAKDNGGVWGQSEVLIIMDVDEPIITITPPGSDLNGNVNFRGVVEDGAGDAFITVMDKVEAKIDGGTYQTITGTYSWLWPYNTQALADGAHTLWIRAYDKAGNVAETSSAFSVSQATDKPNLTIANLGEGMVIGGTYIISGTVSDDDGIAAAADGIQLLIEYETSPDVWAVYQAWTDVTNRSGPQTNYSITYPLPNLPSGSYRLNVRARDVNSAGGDYGAAVLPQANYWSAIAAPIRFKVDNDVPVVDQASISPATGSYVNGGFTLSGAISEDQNLISARIFVNGIDRGAAGISGTAPNYSFNVTVDQAWLGGSGGVNSIRIDATDNSSPPKVGSATVQIIFDDSKPSASFLSPATDSTVNGIITISGLANDDNQVTALYYAIRATSAGLPAYPGDYTLLADQRYSFNFTANTALLADETAYTVYLVAVDAAGNHTASAPASLPLLISQNSDRPIVKLSNVRTDGATVLKMVNTVFGSVIDDDGSVAKLEISEDGSSWVEHPLNGGTFSYDSSPGDGAKTIYFRVADAKGTVFSTSAASSLQKPRIETNPAEIPAAYVDGPISYSVDTAPPEIDPTIMTDRSAPFDFADEAALTTNMPFGGASAQFRLRAQAQDSNGISAVNFIVPGAAGSPFSGTFEGGYYRSPTIDAGGLADGPLVITVEAIDDSGLKTSLTRTVIIDNSPPTVSFTNPRSLVDVVNGNIEVKGLASDGGSGLKSVQYKVGYNHAAQSWQHVGGSLFSWQIDFKDADRIDVFANPVDGSDDNLDDIWQVPVLIRAEDNAGNVHTSTITDYVLLVDPSGDKPKAFIIYPDPAAANRTLGGNIRIFGAAEDDDGVQGVYMQVDVNGDGAFDASDVASDGVDWYNGGEGQTVSGTVSWNRTINTAQEFDPPGAGTRTIYFRVRARDIFGLDGAWSLPQRIDVDKNVPKIGSGIPLTLKQGGAELNYVADAWLKGSWSLVGSVEDESGIDSIVISGDVNGSLSANPGWFTNLGGDNYRFEIPITTEASAGRVSFTITALDKSTPQLQTSLSVSAQADNQAPTLNAYNGALPIIQSNLAYTLKSSLNETGSGFGRVAFYFVRRDKLGNAANDRVYMPMAGNTFTYLSSLSLQNGLYYLNRSGASRPSPYTLVDAGLIANENVRVGGVIRIGGLDRTIVSWNGATGTVGWADEVSISVTDYQIAYALIVDNQTVETPVYSGGILTNIINDDGDGMVESVERSGGLYSWTASIDSRNIPDGPIELHWVSFDRAGNSVASSLSTTIANNRPLLAAVTLGTDLDGDGNVAACEKVAAFSALDGQGNMQSTTTVDSSSFVAKGLTTVEIDAVGGNGQLRYILTNATLDLHGGLQTLRATGSSAILPISLSLGDLDSVGEGLSTFTFSIWDSTEETEPGIDSLDAVLNVPFYVNLVDAVPPKAVILPLYWRGSSDNSLFANSKANGHLELPSDLPGALFNEASGLYDLDPKVSGQISFRGTAYDDQRLTSLWTAMDGFSFPGAAMSATQFDTDGDGVLETLARSYYRLATFDAGVWTGTDRWASDGWKFSVSTESLDQGGHKVNWQLDWDSSKVSGVAALDRAIRVLAQDRRTAPQANSSSEIEVVSADAALNNRPSLRIDIAPYIAKLSTPIRNDGGLKDSNIRSSSGRYSIIKGTHNTFITLTGFNLNPNAARIVGSGIVGSKLAPTAGSAIAYSGATAPYTGIYLSNDGAVSGYLEVFTNGVRSLNNVNDNDAKGSYADLNTPELLPNREPDRYITKNLRQTDDRYLRFFSMSSTGIKNGYYPDMIMEGDDPVFGYLNLTGGPNLNVGLAPGTGAGTYYPSHAMPQRAKFNGSTGAEITTEYLIKASIWDQMAMARDAGGRFHHLTLYNRDGASMSYLYDRYAELYTNGQGWGTGTTYSGYGGNISDDTGNNAITLEGVNFGNGLLLGRYQYPKIRAVGNSRTSHAKVYMLYYDDNTTNRDLIFRNLRVGTDVTGGGTAPLFAGGTSSTGDGYAQRANLADNNTSGRIVAASSASRYFDFAVTSDFRVVIVYFDEADGRLKLRYSTGPVDGSAPTAAVAWTSSTVVFPEYVGNYVSLALDGANGIHIAAYDASDADLAYFYLPTFNSTDLYHATVDAAFAVGSWTQIKVRQVGPNVIPYIAYFNSSETGQRDAIKVAYSTVPISPGNVPAGVENGYVTGNWEYFNVPAITPPQGGSLMFKQVNLDFDSMGRPVIGYLGTNLEYGKWLGE